MNIEQMHWMYAFNFVCPVIYPKQTRFKKGLNPDDERCKFSYEQKRALLLQIKSLLETEYYATNIHRILKTKGAINRDDGKAYSYQAIRPYIEQARKEFGLSKPPKPESKKSIVIRMHNAGFGREEIIKILDIHKDTYVKALSFGRKSGLIKDTDKKAA